MNRLSCLFMWLLAGLSSNASATENLCDAAAHQAALTKGVPSAVMKAIARVETGLRREGELQPWPWSLNVQGTAQTFAARSAAEVAIHDLLSHGIRNFDVGCFQINAYWHRHAMHDPRALLDPVANALFAADLLIDHFAETGDWTEAAGRYHSKTPDVAARYKNRFLAALEQVSNGPSRPLAKPMNSYPYFRNSGERGASGSLVPRLSTRASRPLIGG